MNFIVKCFFSMPAMAVLLILFALSCAVATFIENDFGSETAWAVIYASRWFEIIQILLGANLLYNILAFRLYRKEKLPALVFHLGFLFILVGAGLTRYLGYEGTLHIREGESESVVRSSDSFVQVKALKDGMFYGTKHKKLISKLGGNDFSFSFDIKNKKADIDFKEYIPNAVGTIADDENGSPLISLVISKNEASSLTLKEGDEVESEGVIFSFNKKIDNSEKPFVRFVLQDREFSLISNKDIDWFHMGENSKGLYERDEKHSLDDKRLYTIEGLNFTPKYIGLKGKEKLISDKSNQNAYDALTVTLTYNDISQDIVLTGKGKGYSGFNSRIWIDDVMFALRWGTNEINLPFEIKLRDFQLERYPGSSSPSSYASEITVVDKEANVELPYRIYMNNVLDYKGYRFFQAFYDEDEKGTVLSVNKDPGKIPTYIGYILLSLGLLWNIFNKKSRFRKLARDINAVRDSFAVLPRDDLDKKPIGKKTKTAKVLSLALFAFICSQLISPYPLMASENKTTINVSSKEAKKHAEFFGTILTQSMDGRIYPVDTAAHEILNKVHRGDKYKGMNANQILFAMLVDPDTWQNEPIIRVSHAELKKLIGIKDSYASFNDFLDENGEYKLKKVVEIADRKKEAEKNTFDKDAAKVDERLNIVYSTFNWDVLRIVPKIDDKNQRWYSINEALALFEPEEAENVRMIFGFYFDAVHKASQTGNWTTANSMAEVIKKYQEAYGSKIIPSQTKVDTEIFFNKAKIFDRIYIVYLFSGLILLMFVFVKMLSSRFNISKVVNIFFVINLIVFAAHTIGLALRWYIAEHAPWSNSYESMIYIAWAIALSGLLFTRTSIVSTSLSYIMAGVTLFTAHLNWLDPHITNLMPVLKSHWLTIHVSVITASYGFLGLCALLGFFTLILYMGRCFSVNKDEVERNITEAVKINEMSMILGLSLLTVGNFLGGVWANESWGRYWGWDPKETWALISILVYAVIVHFRFIPKFNNQFAFSVFSIIAYSSIIMTYFGVNFYLSGQHSYASGDPVPVPIFVWCIAVAVILTIALSSYSVKKEIKQGRGLKRL